MSFIVGQTSKAAGFSECEHNVSFQEDLSSSSVGMAARPPARVHFNAAAALANDMLSRILSWAPIAKA
jgi:hypothetical protein